MCNFVVVDLLLKEMSVLSEAGLAKLLWKSLSLSAAPFLKQLVEYRYPF